MLAAHKCLKISLIVIPYLTRLGFMGITFEVLHVVFNWRLLSNGAAIYPFETYMLALMYVIIKKWKSNICKQKWNENTEYSVCTSRQKYRNSWYSNIVGAVVRLSIQTEIEIEINICSNFLEFINSFLIFRYKMRNVCHVPCSSNSFLFPFFL